ncbi:putative F-box/FBD/LRR-repeat protein At4g03220 [Prunus avium]|uniref:F-box/FBD/LRR-repeat protein At4g03220 n=1 Tax=Prunus avium TaxID=42229 RepID=A0A6P5S669_PRUAV|nr:putative F-box/FBD/LRR-repeat protein At4g03220 [Prunus avium]
METKAAKKRRLIEEENERNGRGRDRFSDLPNEISNHIFSFLPMKSIAQVSFTSKRWRSLWDSFPILDFSEVCPFTSQVFQKKSVGQIFDHQMSAMRFISSVLSGRHENCDIKSFAFSGYWNSVRLHDWIPWLVKHRVENLVLKFCSNNVFCGPGPPPSTSLGLELGFSSSHVRDAGGLRSLRTLSLTNVNLSDVYGDLFSDFSFPLLEKLTIESCRSMNQLRIFCENLKDLQVCGMEIICLDISGMGLERLLFKLHLTSVISNSCVKIFAPNLQTFQWGADEVAEKGLVHFWLPVNDAKLKTHTVVILSALSQAEKLTISFQFLEILSKKYFEGGLPFSFVNLKTLEIITAGLRKSDFPGIACLFKSSPIVERLKIVISPIHRPQDDKWNDILLDNALWSEEQFWESQAQTLNSFLCHIKEVDFSVVTGIDETVISVARFLLKHGIGLQEMNICPQNWKAYQQNQPGWQAKFKIIEELPRASEDVQIVWLF